MNSSYIIPNTPKSFARDMLGTFVQTCSRETKRKVREEENWEYSAPKIQMKEVLTSQSVLALPYQPTAVHDTPGLLFLGADDTVSPYIAGGISHLYTESFGEARKLSELVYDVLFEENEERAAKLEAAIHHSADKRSADFYIVAIDDSLRSDVRGFAARTYIEYVGRRLLSSQNRRLPFLTSRQMTKKTRAAVQALQSESGYREIYELARSDCSLVRFGVLYGLEFLYEEYKENSILASVRFFLGDKNKRVSREAQSILNEP